MEFEVDDEVSTLKSSISKVQTDIESNPYNYDAHVELISLLSRLYSLYKSEESKCDDSEKKKVASEQTAILFKKLRRSRQSMNFVYPLSTELWMKWIDDEINAHSSIIDHEIIEQIFSKATTDYLSVDIWCSYMNYLIGRLEDGGSTPELIRDAFEKAVTNCGLHYKDGHKIWECYQKFELKFLFEVEKSLEESSNDMKIEQLKTHLLKVVKLYKREMSLALAKHDELLTQFKETVGPHIETLKMVASEDVSFINMDEIENIHQNTSTNLELIKTNEDYLEESNHSLEAYQSYISHELESGSSDPARIQCLFERAVVYHCLKPSLWLDYIDFLNNVIKLRDLVISVSKRALCNVSWDSRVDIKYAVILEQESRNVDEIRAVYEKGLEKYSNNGYNYCNVVIAYLSFENRKYGKSSINKMRPRIYKMIQQAVRQLEKIEDADRGIVEFVLCWVDIERFWFNNEEKVKDIWKYMLAKYKSLWYPAITYMRTVGSADLINDTFSIALLRFSDDIETFSQSLLNYENALGSFESLNLLTKKVNLCLPLRIQARKTKESQSLLSKIEHKRKFIKSWLRNVEKSLFSLKFDSLQIESPVKKNKRPHKENITAQNTNKGIKKVYLGVDDYEGKQKNENHADASSNNPPLIGPAMPPGFLPNVKGDSESEDSVEDDHDEMPPSKRQRVIENKTEDKSTRESDGHHPQNTTVFASNLHPATKETDLNIIFSRAGEVQKVDLRKQKGGKIFAFITYATPEEAQKAFELEHTPLFNRPIYVSEFKYTKNSERSSTGSAKYSQQQERNKLYVSNLHKATTQIDLEKLFNQYGDMSSLRLVNKKGSSRSFAYVEYATVEAATRYLKAINNTIVRGKMISVEFSNPSVVNQWNRQREFNIGEVKTSSNSEKPTKMKFYDAQTKPETVVSSSSKTENDGISEEVFVKPKPVKLGLIPFQARSFKSQQSSNKEPLTKTGPAVRINFVPSSSNAPSKTDEPTSQESNPVCDSTEDQSSAAAVSSARKSNEEFRKMFLKN